MRSQPRSAREDSLGLWALQEPTARSHDGRVLSISDTVDAQAAAARHKVALLAVPGLFLVRTMLAGAYIGIGVLIMATAGGPLAAAGSPFTPLVQGLVFGVALTVVLVAGAKLATSAMMVLTQGALRGAVGWGEPG